MRSRQLRNVRISQHSRWSLKAAFPSDSSLWRLEILLCLYPAVSLKHVRKLASPTADNFVATRIFSRLPWFGTGLSPARTKTKVLRVQLHGLVLRRDCEISSCSQADRGKMDAGSLFFWPAYEEIIKKRNGFQRSISFVFILLFHLCHRFDSWERFVCEEIYPAGFDKYVRDYLNYSLILVHRI